MTCGQRYLAHTRLNKNYSYRPNKNSNEYVHPSDWFFPLSFSPWFGFQMNKNFISTESRKIKAQDNNSFSLYDSNNNFCGIYEFEHGNRHRISYAFTSIFMYYYYAIMMHLPMCFSFSISESIANNWKFLEAFLILKNSRSNFDTNYDIKKFHWSKIVRVKPIIRPVDPGFLGFSTNYIYEGDCIQFRWTHSIKKKR